VPLTSYPGIEEYPSLSPDGNRLAFCWNGEDGHNVDIYIKPLDTSLADPVRLTTHAAPDVSPAWSPDGRSIAFARHSAPGEMKIMLIPSVGGAERELKTAQVTWERDAGSYLAWTPDGKGLVFPDRESPLAPVALFRISLENGESRRLTSPPYGWWGDSSPSFSPDGRQLAFERLKTLTVSDIFAVAIGKDGNPGGGARRLTATEHGAMNPVWTNDGREILFVAAEGAEPRIQRISASGLGPPSDVVPDAVLPVFSLAGSNLVFSRGSFDTNIWRIDLGSLSSRAGGGSSFIASTLNDSWADYCPRGENVVYLSDRSGAPELWISDSGGANSRQLTSLGGPRLTAPRWAPDGEHIAFAAWQDGSADIYLMHGAGGAPAPLTADPAEDLWPSWSHDGRWIYFASNRSGEWQVWKTPAARGVAGEGASSARAGRAGPNSIEPAGPAGSNSNGHAGHGGPSAGVNPSAQAAAHLPIDRNPPVNRSARVTLAAHAPPDAHAAPDAQATQAAQVTTTGGNAAMESPDGRFLFFTKGGGATSLWKMPVEGGEETLIAENLFGAANFFVTREGVYFISRPDEEPGGGAGRSTFALKFFRFATGKTSRVTKIDQPADLGLTVSPDSRHLLYPQWDQFEADLILQRLPE
jgi:Tol biopolymer transport system component